METFPRRQNLNPPRGRVGMIEEVVNVVVFLASDQATYVSGSNVIVDGGMSIRGEQPRL